MRIGRRYGIASLFMAGGVALAGCQTVSASAESDPANAPASVETASNGGPSRLTLVEEAAQRLGVETAPVEARPNGLSIPYAAVVYDAEGAAWTFVELEPRVYERAPITISGIEGERATLSDGPEPGTPVVTVGAAELVGVEAGISGGE